MRNTNSKSCVGVESLEERSLFATNGLTATYFDQINLAGPSIARVDSNINFTWGKGSPAATIGAETFSARWTGEIQPRFSEEYTFFTSSDDGVRVWIDDQIIIDKWYNQSGNKEHSGKVQLQANQQHDIRVEYYEDSGNASVRLLWSSASQAKQIVPTQFLFPAEVVNPQGQGNGLLGYYFDNSDLTNLKLTRKDAYLGFNWGSGSPDPMIGSNTFSVRWIGQIEIPKSDLYIFSTTSDDGVRLWVNDQLIINNWNNHSPTVNSGSISLSGNAKYKIKLEYFENTGGAVMQLRWSSPSIANQIVPKEFLYSIAAEQVVAMFTIGGSSTVPEDRHVGGNIKTEGWAGFVQHFVQPLVNRGVRKILLLNPFGLLLNEPMQFDQYIHANEAGLNWLVEGFASAWQPITAQGVEVIAYLGSIEGDPDFSTRRWQERFWASTNALINSKMSIAFDGVSLAAIDSIAYQAVRLAEGAGVKVYVEPRPHKDYTHWHDYGVISADSFWLRSDPALFPDSATWAAPTNVLSGEIIRLITAPPPGSTWQDLEWARAYIASILSQGHTPAFGGTGLLQLLA